MLPSTLWVCAALNNLKHRPYSEFRMANVTVRVQVRCSGVCMQGVE